MGSVSVSGAKNAATRLLAAAFLHEGPVVLRNFPTELVDARHKKDFMTEAGAEVVFDPEKETASIQAGGISNKSLRNFDVPVRTTYLLAAGLLRKEGLARIPYPAGCKIGKRGYNLHIMVWEQLGCSVTEKEDYIEIRTKQLRGGKIRFPISTIGGTENALITASVAQGDTEIYNAYISPEVQNLIDFLKASGVRIEVTGNSYIRVEGTAELQPVTFEVIPDRIEAVTWIIYAVLSGGNILIRNVPFDLMKIPLEHLQGAGVDLFRNSSSVYLPPDYMDEPGIQPFELACGTYPGVISDMQPFYVLLAMKARGISRIYDYRYPDRNAYLDELNKMCDGSINYRSGMTEVQGPVIFRAAEVHSTDLRGSMAVTLAALLSREGSSRIHDIRMAFRGYNKLQEKLEGLGLEIEIVSR